MIVDAHIQGNTMLIRHAGIETWIVTFATSAVDWTSILIRGSGGAAMTADCEWTGYCGHFIRLRFWRWIHEEIFLTDAVIVIVGIGRGSGGMRMHCGILGRWHVIFLTPARHE